MAFCVRNPLQHLSAPRQQRSGKDPGFQIKYFSSSILGFHALLYLALQTETSFLAVQNNNPDYEFVNLFFLLLVSNPQNKYSLMPGPATSNPCPFSLRSVQLQPARAPLPLQHGAVQALGAGVRRRVPQVPAQH